MEFITKTFEGGWNAEADPANLHPTEYLEAENMQMMATGMNNGSVLKPVPGTDLIPHNISSLNGYCVGIIKDKSKSRFFYFMKTSASTEGDKIFEYNLQTGSTKLVLEWTGFNFQETHLITGGGVIGDLLFWTDDLSAPRFINVERAKSGDYPTPLQEENISINRRPPNFPLQNTKLLKSEIPVGFFEKGSVAFIYRYVYLDHEPSTWSIPSRSTLPNWYFGEKCDQVKVEIPLHETIPEDVAEIHFAAIDKETWATVIFEKVKRSEKPDQFMDHPGTLFKAYFNGQFNGPAVP
ncbi:MAG TPA: hypothetical protein DCG19_03275, partial [Cryomorphaceae bacterium]|nr:hypothetical protein [Cryomorphaceae bacterium]